MERAYQRGDHFEKRRRLMAEWERYCEQKPVASESPAVSTQRGDVEQLRQRPRALHFLAVIDH